MHRAPTPVIPMKMGIYSILFCLLVPVSVRNTVYLSFLFFLIFFYLFFSFLTRYFPCIAKRADTRSVPTNGQKLPKGAWHLLATFIIKKDKPFAGSLLILYPLTFFFFSSLDTLIRIYSDSRFLFSLQDTIHEILDTS